MRPTCESQRAFSTLSFHSSADHRYLHSFPTRRSSDLAGYYPGGETLHIKILYHSETNKLLGGQIIGKKGVDKRIDVLATALYSQMTVQQLVDLDLAYAPPYNGVWDPLQQMARKTF